MDDGKPNIHSSDPVPATCLGAEDGMPKTRTSPVRFAWETADIEVPLKDECAGSAVEVGSTY
jgi:hypothetical protein